MKIVIGISGASGVIYSKRLIEYLHEKHELFVSISSIAKQIFEDEINEKFSNFIKTKSVKLFDNDNFYSPLASGSFKIDACIILPCSMKTLSAIANGYADSLITRCADVTLKQKRKVILAPREMPFSAIHLENMLKLSRLGVSIMIPSPAFYSKPKTLQDIIDFVVGKVLDELNIDNDLYLRWS